MRSAQPCFAIVVSADSHQDDIGAKGPQHMKLLCPHAEWRSFLKWWFWQQSAVWLCRLGVVFTFCSSPVSELSLFVLDTCSSVLAKWQLWGSVIVLDRVGESCFEWWISALCCSCQSSASAQPAWDRSAGDAPRIECLLCNGLSPNNFLGDSTHFQDWQRLSCWWLVSGKPGSALLCRTKTFYFTCFYSLL